MKKTLVPRLVTIILLSSATSFAMDRFDGQWLTKLTCLPKGSTSGYTWEFPATIQDSNFIGEHGTAGEPGYLRLEGKIADNGSVKLAANGIVASRQYARGAFAHNGEDYSYDVKAQFKEAEGTGTRNEGMGIAGRPCVFEFKRQTNPEGVPSR
jgi:hypothetical protein